MTVVRRTCTEIVRDADVPRRGPASQPLCAYRSSPAFVLLGDPGAGKSTSFREERKHTAEAADEVIEARDFVTFDVARRPEWRNRTLFIDGLDEIRAGQADGRTALDQVRRQLDALGRPRFRLSCREADWLTGTDRKRLEAVVPEDRITVLRLDPLTPEDAETIVASARGQGAAAFLAKAREQGLEGLLQNPQNLELLLAAVSDGRWPDSRRELFEAACRQLVQEQNPEQQDADRARPAEAQILEAAGRICALLLLSGIVGVDPSSAASDDGARYAPLSRFDPTPAGASPADTHARNRLQRLVLSSRLFRAAPADSPAGRRFEPVHRHIAEFLAARYLAARIEGGPPAARVLALMTAGDGGVVTSYRGLAAWLAAHSEPARRDLIARDPIGLGLYGDIGDFSIAAKKSLLDALVREGRRLNDIGYGNVAAFAPLAVPELESDFQGRLAAPPTSEGSRYAVKFVLGVLNRGEPMPATVAPIRKILDGQGWGEDVTLAALDAFVRQCRDPDTRTDKLKQILADIQNRRLPDPDNELAATILDALYPETITPSEIWRHLAQLNPPPGSFLRFGRYYLFWSRKFEEKTSDEDTALLLDALAAERPDLALIDQGLGDGRALAEKFLARALVVHGHELTPERLNEWLDGPARTQLEFHEIQHRVRWKKASAQVRSWLEGHPDKFKAAFLESIRRHDGEQDLARRLNLAPHRFRQAQPPAAWLLNQARETADTDPVLARRLFHQVLLHHRQDLSDELIAEAVREHPVLQPPPPDPEAESEERERLHREKMLAKAGRDQRVRAEKRFLDAVRADTPALQENRGAPRLLRHFATRWLQRHDDRALSLLEWLKGELGGQEDLAAAVAAGLRGAIDREDLPEADEILRLHGQNRRYLLSTPTLVSLDERDLGDPRFVAGLTERQRRQACAFYFTEAIRRAHAHWYRRLLERDLELVAEVLVAAARIELRSGRENATGLWNLEYGDRHAALARIASLPLLRAFPTRGRARQLPDLALLLGTALQHADRTELLQVIEKKLGGSSMTVNQRVRWLAAGVFAAPDACADRLAEFAGGKEQRARQLANFLWSERPRGLRPQDLPPRALEVLIRQTAAAFPGAAVARGRGRGADGLIRQTAAALAGRELVDEQPNAQHESVYWRLSELIDGLAASPEAEAGAALRRLADDPALQHWQYRLEQARDRQATVSRDSSSRPPALDQVLATLDDLAPANAADLAALALDRLDRLAESTRHSNSNVWSQYWNQDGNGNPTDPKPENACRDALLSRLRQRLPPGVDAQPEGQYTANRRADIRLAGADFHVPVEIKKNTHRSLWRAARDQLAARYTQDPATGGYGIFLVLWFGETGSEKTPLDDTGTRPGSAEELHRRLDAGLARQLPPERLRRIAVRVIDVSKP